MSVTSVPTISRILVAVKKPDAKKLPAVEKAAQLALAFGAEIELFNAISRPIYTGRVGRGIGAGEHVAHTRRMKMKGLLETVAGPLRKRGITVGTYAGWGSSSPADAVARRAKRIKGDLIVAECHARDRRGSWRLSFTDRQLVRLSAVPLLLVKGNLPYRRPKVLAAVDPTLAFAKPAKLDDEILRYARSMQQALRGTLHVVHAYAPILPRDARYSRYNAEEIRVLREQAREKAVERLQPLLKKAKVAARRRHLVAGDAIRGIASAAQAIGSAVVIMGTVSRAGLKRIVIGNTAESILDALRCDALVIKPPV
jgi:universal stress protein E